MVGLRKANFEPFSSCLKGLYSILDVHNIRSFFTVNGFWPEKQGLLLFLLIFITGCSKPDGSYDQLMAKGHEFANQGNKKEAYRYYKAAIEKEENKPLVHYAASKVAPDNNSSYRHISSAWNGGLRSRGVLYDYIAYSFFTSIEKKKEFAFNLFDQMSPEIANDELKGELLYFLGDYDSALSVWKESFQREKNLDMAKKVASAYAAKGLIDSVEVILQDKDIIELLDLRAQIMLAAVYSAKYEYRKIDSMFISIRKSKEYLPPIIVEDLTFQFLSGGFSSVIKNAEIFNATKINMGSMEEKFKLLLAAASIFSGNLNNLEVFKRDEAEVGVLTVEDSVIHLLSENKIDSALSVLERSRTDVQNSVRDMLEIALLVANDENAQALARITQLPALYKESFAMLPIFSNLMANNGKDSLALELLERMHSRNYTTQNTLRLERDIYISAGNLKKAKKAHLELDKKHPIRSADPGLARIYVLGKKYELANREYLKVIKQYPENCAVRIEFAKELFNRKEYKRALLVLRKSPCKVHVSNISIQAEALIALGMKDDAYKLYDDLYDKMKNNLDFVEAYSLFLYKLGDFKKSAELYKHVSDDEFLEIVKSNNVRGNIFINNYIWRKITANLKLTDNNLSWIKSIYLNSGKQTAFRSTYGAALRALELYPDCLLLYKDMKIKDLIKEEIFILADCRFKLGYYNDAYNLFSIIKDNEIEMLDMDKKYISDYIKEKLIKSELKRRKNVN